MDFQLITRGGNEILNFHHSAIDSATKDGYRLATVNEARNDLKKVRDLFTVRSDSPHQYVRLLDGWMSQYDDPTVGYREFVWDWWLFVKKGKSSLDDLYSGLSLTEKEWALLFFTRDGCKELVEWLLNSIEKETQSQAGKKGIEFKEAADLQRTPLHLAFFVSREDEKKEMVNLILKHCGDEKALMRRPDVHGMTALLEAVKGGHEEIVKELLQKGSQPIEERDTSGKTALHYAVEQYQWDGSKARSLAKLLLGDCYLDKCKSLRANQQEDKCICKWMLLWARASGVGTAQQSAESLAAFSVSRYLLKKMKMEKSKGINLLRIAAQLENERMIQDLLQRGFLLDIAESCSKPDPDGSKIQKAIEKHVEKFNEKIDWMNRNASVDTPATEDSLGRKDIATGVASLFLNPYVASPIVVGLSGASGSGKSSLMIQVERILLQTAAQLLFPNLWHTTEAESIGESSTALLHQGRVLHDIVKKKATQWMKIEGAEKRRAMEKEAKKFLVDDTRKHENLDPVQCLLGSEFRDKFENVFKSLAIIDKSLIIKTGEDDQSAGKFALLKKAGRRIQCAIKCIWSNPQPAWPRILCAIKCIWCNRQPALQPSHKLSPGILTVRYNAWLYRDESQAWAGLAVEITREMEKRMSWALQLHAAWIYAWRRNKVNLILQLFFPILLVAALAPWIGWGAWVLMSRSKAPGLESFRYGCIPVSVIVILWIILNNLLHTLNSVSDQFQKYLLNAGGHNAEKLGYQQTVIEDIQMMMEMLGKDPFCLWKVVEYCTFSAKFHRGRDKDESPELNLKTVKSASKEKLRVIVFVDNLDKCLPQSVFEILSAIHLILAECKINVVLGTDMNIVKKAIKSSLIQASYKGVKIQQDMPTIYDNTELEAETDKYLQKIFQLPLDVPDPSKAHFHFFLDRRLLGAESKANDMQPASSTNEQNVSSSNQSQHQSTSVADQSQSHDLEQGNTHGESHRKPSCGDETKEENTNRLRLPVSTGMMLILDYTKSQQEAFRDLGKLVTINETNPREWKRLLLYHNLVWNILSQRPEVTKLRGWEMQLVMWVFICWRWKEEMDHIIHVIC